MYREKLSEERRKDQRSPQPVLRIPTQPKERPPLMGDLDTSLLKFLKAIRAKGGVINIHVVQATADALMKSHPNETFSFEMNRSWVQSVYRRLGYKRRLGTTSRPPVPRGLYEESHRGFLGDIMHYVKLHSFHLI
uniref:HTH CENPB-type domain-containing protein n=1 Tax=Amphimedon queenslandica TaxID=400682 RepID=A0A1X7VKY6_AMPQE